VRSISGSVSKTWNSINPATLSGAIDVIVIEQEDGGQYHDQSHVAGIGWVLTCDRDVGLFALPRSLRQVLVTAALREKGTVR